MGTNSNLNSFLLFLEGRIGTKLGRMGCLGLPLSGRLYAILFSESRNLYQLNLCQFESKLVPFVSNGLLRPLRDVSYFHLSLDFSLYLRPLRPYDLAS